MSVICSAPTAAPAASSGVQTRRTAPSSAGSNVLLVKGAAECLLGRSSHVSLPLASPALHAPASHSGHVSFHHCHRTLSQISYTGRGRCMPSSVHLDGGAMSSRQSVRLI